MNQKYLLYSLLLAVIIISCNKSKKEEVGIKQPVGAKIESIAILPKKLDFRLDLVKEQIEHNEFKRAIFYSNELIEESKNFKNKDGEAWGYYEKGFIYDQHLGLHDSALINYHQSLSLRKEIGDQKHVNYCYLGMAGAYYKLEFPDRAESYYNLAIDHAKKINDKSTEAAAYRGMGLVHQNLKNDYVVAALHYAKCLELQKELTNKEGIADAYHSLAGTYYLREDFKQAEVYYLKALEYRIANENSRLADTYFSLGLVHKELKNYTSAKLYFNKSLDVSERVSYSTLIVRSHMEFGIIAQLQKNYPTAIQELTIAQQLAEQDKTHI
jgi:tetratricopeptide (TPR) repeat protein